MHITFRVRIRQAARDFAVALTYLVIGLGTSVVSLVCWSLGFSITPA